MSNLLANNFLAIFVVAMVFSRVATANPVSKEEVQNTNNHNDETKNNDVNEEEIKLLWLDALDYAHNIGLIIRTNDQPHKSNLSGITPVTLFPTTVPRKMFEKANAVREAMALLYFRVARNYDFLNEVLGEAAKSDYSTRELLSIVKDVQEEGVHQPIALVLQRSDYMFNEIIDADTKEKEYELKQIEVNNGPIGGMVVEHATKLHRRMLELSNMDAGQDVLPENRAYETVAEGLYRAWKAFEDEEAIVIMIVGRIKNPFQYEQRQLEYMLEEMSEGKLKIWRLNLFQLDEKLKLGEDFSLMLDDKKVGLVYFRLNLLIPERLQTTEGLRVRRLIERSTAIKSPPMSLELATTKKVQQYLAKPGMLERFFTPAEADMVTAIRSTFAGLWGLDQNDEKTEAIIQDAIAHPENYVLKPNREGGGHNFWGEEIAEKLNTFTPTDRVEHILQQRLHPPVTQNYLIKQLAEPKLENVVTEFSTYCALLGNFEDGTVLYNKGYGHLMRTKIESVTEGGIMEGSGYYDTPYLID